MPGAVGAVNDGKEKYRRRIETITSFACDLAKRLPNDKDEPRAAEALLVELKKEVQTLEKYSSKPSHGMLGDEDMDREGTNLWNLCTRLNRETRAKSSDRLASKLIWTSRVLAYQILHLCQWSTNASANIACHLMRIALKAAKFCTDGHDVQTARSVLQRAADYHGRLLQLSQTAEPDEVDECTQLEAEWTAMRIVLAWQDGQPEIAEHTYTKAHDLLKRSSPVSAERIADAIFQVGKGFLAKQDYPLAEKWLHRAWDLINNQQLQAMSRDAVELRMVVLQALVTVSMGVQTTESIEKAQNLVRYVESEVGNQPAILLLNLEILSKSPAEAFDGEAYAEVLRRMIRGFQPTDASFKLLAHQIHVLHAKCPTLGCSVLEEFLSTLVKHGRAEWTDKFVVKRVHMAVSHRDFEGTIEDCRKAVSRLENPVSADAAFAAQTLIWKKVESNYSQQQYEIAERWCLLALMSEFGASGLTNKAKLERKLLMCALARNDCDFAKSTYFGMAQDTQQDPLTQFLMYRVTIRSGDAEIATQCLKNIAGSSSTSMELLYACVADSQRVGHKLTVLEAMKKIAEVHDIEHPGQLHLPALFRCNIMLLHGFLDDKNAKKTSVIADLCQIFDAVVAAVQKEPKDGNGNVLFDVKELEWFCQNAYNLGLKHAGAWDLRSVVRILTACSTLIRSFPDQIAVEQASDLLLRSIFCNFLSSSALVALARAEDNIEQHLQDYLVARRHIEEADTAIQLQLQSKNMDNASTADLLDKLAQLLAFDFEAAVALKKYQDLSEIVLKAEQCQNLDTYKTMADCALRGQLHPEELFSVLRKIINQISDLDDSDPPKLAKYTRCLFQVILPTSEELGRKLLDEAFQMAKGARGTPAAWPTEEVEWFASIAYNHAIDLRCQDQAEACKWWAEKAISIAHYSDDGGQLEARLQENYVKHQLGGQSLVA